MTKKETQYRVKRIELLGSDAQPLRCNINSLVCKPWYNREFNIIHDSNMASWRSRESVDGSQILEAYVIEHNPAMLFGLFYGGWCYLRNKEELVYPNVLIDPQHPVLVFQTEELAWQYLREEKEWKDALASAKKTV